MISKLFTKMPIFGFSQVTQTIAGHKAPALTDNVSGRYAGSLFTAASKSQALQTVADDLLHLKGVIKQSPQFREILKNSAIRKNKQKQIFASFAQKNYHTVTQGFISTVIEGGRLAFLQKTIDTYLDYCKILNKEQDIKVISAVELKNDEKDRVIQSLKKNKPETRFKITYQVDPAILGGLQIFAGTDFLDCSLRSRMERLKAELSRIA